MDTVTVKFTCEGTKCIKIIDVDGCTEEGKEIAIEVAFDKWLRDKCTINWEEV